MKHPIEVTEEAVPLAPVGHLLYEVTLLRLENIATLPNHIYIYSKGAKNEETGTCPK